MNKEQIRVSRSPRGGATVTVTLTDEDSGVSASWSSAAFASTAKSKIPEARAGAQRLLADLLDEIADDKAAA